MTETLPLFTATFYFVRHGETTLNAQGVIAGWIDTPLTDLGRAQAEAAADRLASVAVGSVFSSHLVRARDTAAAIAARHGGLTVTAVPGIAERNLGVWEGQPQDVLVRSAKPEGGEGPQEFHERCLAALATIRGRPPLVVVGHSGTFRVLRTHLCGGDTEDRIPNGHPVRFDPPAVPGGAWRYAVL